MPPWQPASPAGRWRAAAVASSKASLQPSGGAPAQHGRGARAADDQRDDQARRPRRRRRRRAGRRSRSAERTAAPPGRSVAPMPCMTSIVRAMGVERAARGQHDRRGAGRGDQQHQPERQQGQAPKRLAARARGWSDGRRSARPARLRSIALPTAAGLAPALRSTSMIAGSGRSASAPAGPSQRSSVRRRSSGGTWLDAADAGLRCGPRRLRRAPWPPRRRSGSNSDARRPTSPPTRCWPAPGRPPRRPP